MSTVFITGASGLIGTELTEALLSKKFNVIGTDEKPNNFVGQPNYSFIQANIEDKDRITSVFNGSKIDAVIHLACTVDNGWPSVITPSQEKEIANVDKYFYKAAASAGVSDFIMLSTHQVYANQKSREPIREDLGEKPFSLYGKLKYESEKAFLKTVGKTAVNGVVMRVCPIYTKTYSDNLKSRIFDPKDGCCYVYGYGDYGFSFCCLYNLIDFIVAALQTKVQQGVYNICDSKPISAKNIVEFLREFHKLGPVIQKNYGTDAVRAAVTLTNSKTSKADYRYNDIALVCSNISYDNTKAQRISTFRWKLSNTK